MTTTDIIDTTAQERESEPKAIAKPEPSATEFDPGALPSTRDELAALIEKCLRTDDPATEGIPPVFHSALAKGIHDGLMFYREFAVGAGSEDYVKAIDTLAPLFEAFAK